MAREVGEAFGISFEDFRKEFFQSTFWATTGRFGFVYYQRSDEITSV